MRALWSRGLLLPVVLLALAACGPVEFFRHPSGPVETRHTEPPRRPAPSAERTTPLRPEIRRKLASGDYRSALNLLRKEIKGGLPEADLADEYGQALNGLLGEAELSMDQGLPDKAGEQFRCALDGFPKTEGVANNIEMTSSEILARIDDCAGALMERGLVAYRAGDLEKAIGTWKMIQAFNPCHQASKKALETAEVQKANLEKVSTKN